MDRRGFLLIAAAAALAGPALAQEPATRTQIVRFRRGSSSATLGGSIRGYETVDYILGARAGQTMSVRLSATRGSTYYLILAPDGGEPLFDSANGGDFSDDLPTSGDWAVRVYNFRNEARRNRASAYTLTVAIIG